MHDMPPPKVTEAVIPGDSASSIVLLVGVQLLLPACGALLGWWCLVAFLLPTLGLGDSERVYQTGEHLQHRLPTDSPYLCALGNSIAQDGIDAAPMQAALPTNCVVENLANPGAKLHELMTLLPLVLDAEPRVVMFGVGPSDFYNIEIPGDKRYAMSFGGFIDAWPPGYGAELPSDCSRPLLYVNGLPAWRKWVHFRPIPVLWVNSNFRLIFRKGHVRSVSDDWTSPFMYQSAISPEQLAFHISSTRHLWSQAATDMVNFGSQLSLLARHTKDAGATPVFLMYPVHPELREVAAPLVARIKSQADSAAAEFDGLTIDSTLLLRADEYNDAVHPNAAGRRKWSQQIGETLAAHGLPKVSASKPD